MNKDTKKKDMRKSKQLIIINKIVDFIQEIHTVGTHQHLIIWIKRIIIYIANELPKTEKYQRFITLIRENIKTNEVPPSLVFTQAVYVGDILKDLIQTVKYDFDDDHINDFYIDLHPKVKEHSLELFNDGHYAQAIFESAKALNNYVKEKAGITNRDLSDAMTRIFNENKPIIKLNDLATRSDKDEQEGFRFLYMGAMKSIRSKST